LSVWAARAPFVVGHRGGRGQGWPPENTLEAFDRARLQGALAVELDVRTSADGQAVVFHDPSLTRMTSGRDVRRAQDVPFDRLRTVDLGDGARIPRLAEVLAWGRDHTVGVNVELKYDVPDRLDVVRVTLRAVRASRADVLLSSFDPFMLAIAAALAPSIPRALLTHAGQPSWAARVQDALRAPLLSAIHLERTQVAPGSIAQGRRRLRVGIWTVNSPAEAVDFVRRGADWIISDAPGDVLDALRHQAAAPERDAPAYSQVTASTVIPGGGGCSNTSGGSGGFH
jgi:glycerophosphoryl diester phosphodiesterase